MLSLDQLMENAKEARASDIHIASDKRVMVRVDGQLQPLTDTPISAADCERFAIELVGDRYESMRECGEADGGATFGGNRCRVHVYRQQGQVSIALRILNMHIPDLETLRLPAAVHKFPDYKRGIVLVTGQTGAGKSTTLAAVLDRINHTYNKHIVTLEDPIEYLYQPDKCLISQREIGADTKSFAEGLRASLREDPDVILVGEMRDPETTEIALTAAETGHLVFATLHTNSAAETIDRIVDVFPEARQNQVRIQVASTLQAVVCQQLLPLATGKGRVAAVEVMVANPAIRNLIRSAKTPQIANAQATSAAEGSITMDNALVALYLRRLITREVAMQAAQDQEYVKKSMMAGGRMMT